MLKGKFKLIIIALIALISVIGVTYAFFVYYKVGSNNRLIFGNIYLTLDDGTDTLRVTNVFPETVEEARARTDNLLTFTVSGLNTTADSDINYKIMLIEGNDEAGRLRANTEHLVFDLIQVNDDNTETLLVDAVSFENFNDALIWSDYVYSNTNEKIERTYKLRMWLSEDVFISDTNANADYSTDFFRNGFASVKIAVDGEVSACDALLAVAEATCNESTDDFSSSCSNSATSSCSSSCTSSCSSAGSGMGTCMNSCMSSCMSNNSSSINACVNDAINSCIASNMASTGCPGY